MDFPEGSNVKAPGGFKLSLGAFLRFLTPFFKSVMAKIQPEYRRPAQGITGRKRICRFEL